MLQRIFLLKMALDNGRYTAPASRGRINSAAIVCQYRQYGLKVCVSVCGPECRAEIRPTRLGETVQMVA